MEKAHRESLDRDAAWKDLPPEQTRLDNISSGPWTRVVKNN